MCQDGRAGFQLAANKGTTGGFFAGLDMTAGLHDWKGDAGNWVGWLESVETADGDQGGMSWGRW